MLTCQPGHADETNGQDNRPVFATATLLLDRADGTTLTYRIELATTPRAAKKAAWRSRGMTWVETGSTWSPICPAT